MKLNSILKKVLMALTGLGLVGFLVGHLAGNLFIYRGEAKFNGYALFLEENEALPLAEGGLIVLFLVHLYLAFRLTVENNSARPRNYEVRQTAGQSSLASRTMILSGLVILGFIILHIYQFKYGTRPDGSLWQLVVNTFQQPWVVCIYVASMLMLGTHLSHGIGSAFQSLGLRNESGRPTLKGLAPVIGWILAAGFAALPLYAFVAKPKPGSAIEMKLKTGLEQKSPDVNTTPKLAGPAHAE